MMLAMLQNPMKPLKKAKYHSSIPTLRPECGHESGCTTGKSIGKDDNADGIHPAELIDQGSQQASDDAHNYKIDAEPQFKHVQVLASPTLVFFLGQHAFYSAGFEAGEAFHFGVPSGEAAFEDGRKRNIVLL